MIFKAMSNQSFSQPDEEPRGCLVSHPGPGLAGANKKTLSFLEGEGL